MRGYGARRSAGTSSDLVTPHPPAASRRAPPSPSGRGTCGRTPGPCPPAAPACLPPRLSA
ncbi:hypothetical protein [Caulobacter endophyticus]|uniref:hypothetical protein n=1 Tax=Caulobacter endophyticus TaxID=2172652 RepID=UPI003D67C19C